MIRIDAETCTRCDSCVRACPAAIIAEGPAIREDIHGYCVSCGHCAGACPSGSITVEGYGDVDLPPYHQDAPISSSALATLLRRRRSVRHYRPGPVSREHLERILEAASLVPTAHNWRAFKAYVCTDKGVLSALHDGLTSHYTHVLETIRMPVEGMPDALREELVFAFDRLVVTPFGGQDRLLWGAGTVLVFTTRILHPLCIGDAWTASFAAVAYAETIPVGTCYNGFLIMGLNEAPPLKSLLRIPEDELVVAGLTLGYPDEEYFRFPPRRTMETTWILERPPDR
ncbi:MAG: nitroreductase family protein [Deltaproteobacteria bacterium]|nr:nitroreductase family protein [Deltaproteobacteria bacterium]